MPQLHDIAEWQLIFCVAFAGTSTVDAPHLKQMDFGRGTVITHHTPLGLSLPLHQAGRLPRRSSKGPTRRQVPLPGAAAPGSGPSPQQPRRTSLPSPRDTSNNGGSKGAPPAAAAAAANRSSSSDMGYTMAMGPSPRSSSYNLPGAVGFNPMDDPAAAAAAAAAASAAVAAAAAAAAGGYGGSMGPYAGQGSPAAAAAAAALATAGYPQASPQHGPWSGFGASIQQQQQQLPLLPPQQQQQQQYPSRLGSAGLQEPQYLSGGGELGSGLYGPAHLMPSQGSGQQQQQQQQLMHQLMAYQQQPGPGMANSAAGMGVPVTGGEYGLTGQHSAQQQSQQQQQQRSSSGGLENLLAGLLTAASAAAGDTAAQQQGGGYTGSMQQQLTGLDPSAVDVMSVVNQLQSLSGNPQAADGVLQQLQDLLTQVMTKQQFRVTQQLPNRARVVGN